MDSVIPEGVISIRRDLCSVCADKAHDPCASCEHGAWGPFIRCEPDLPPLPKMGANAARAAVEETAAIIKSTPPVTDEESARRFVICKTSCEFFRLSDARCSECGCFMNLKAHLRSQHCPVGKW